MINVKLQTTWRQEQPIRLRYETEIFNKYRSIEKWKPYRIHTSRYAHGVNNEEYNDEGYCNDAYHSWKLEIMNYCNLMCNIGYSRNFDFKPRMIPLI